MSHFIQVVRDKAILWQHQATTSTKNPANFENKREESSKFEQKPIKKFNEFSDGERRRAKTTGRKTKASLTRSVPGKQIKKTEIKTRRS